MSPFSSLFTVPSTSSSRRETSSILSESPTAENAHANSTSREVPLPNLTFNSPFVYRSESSNPAKK